MKSIRFTLFILYLFIIQFSTLYAAELAPAGEETTAQAEQVISTEDADRSESKEDTGTSESSEDEIAEDLAVPDEPESTAAIETRSISDTDETPATAEESTALAGDETIESYVSDTVPDISEADNITKMFDEPDTSAIWGSPPDITAPSAVLIDVDTGMILYGKEKDMQNYPASITKIMTALLTLELCDDLSAPLTFSHNSIYSLPRDASHIAMNEGETITLYNALHGLLLASANEVANALAEHIAGSTEDFAELMNKRAAALGAVNTQFTNPSGLYSPNHYTTAYDMALIMQEAVKHPVFVEIIAKRRYDIPPTEKQEQVRELLNTNKLIQPGPYYNEWVIGSKTGYTDEAQHTLVSFAEKDGRSLITAVMYDERYASFTDTGTLLEYGFALPYEEQLIFDSATYKCVLPVYQMVEGVRTLTGEATLNGTKDLTYSLPVGFDKADIRYELSTPDTLTAPVTEGETVGTVTCYALDVPLGKITLTAANSVALLTPEPEPTLQPETRIANETEPGHVPVSPVESSEALAHEPAPNTPYAWEDNYFATLIVPLALSLAALIISFVLFFTRRRRRRAKVLHFDRYTKYGRPTYRYKA